MQIFPFFHNVAHLLFSETVILMINGQEYFVSSNSVCNHTCDKQLDSHCAVVPFHSCNYRPNAAHSPIAITYQQFGWKAFVLYIFYHKHTVWTCKKRLHCYV